MAKTIFVEDIIKKYLEDNGFDGLHNGSDCGCETSNLFPCSESVNLCQPGYKVKCDPDHCISDGNCNWHIAPNKRA